MSDFDEAVAVTVSNTYLTVTLRDGRCVHVPTRWFPRLADATQAERDDGELIGTGSGIHWPRIDEDLSVAGLLRVA